ncbi:MAG: hypothetical protein DMF63_08155 [Acidobacteria bacterium]|nr:MAG: hypothetical protein DMF63_08155 [Acidobacteriota bacterium]
MVTSRSQVSIDDAEALLAAIRGSVLVHVQDGVDPAHLKAPLDSAKLLFSIVQEMDDESLRASAEALEAWLSMLAAESDAISHTRTRSLLDQISELEVGLIALKAEPNAHPIDVGDFVDQSFEILKASRAAKSDSSIPDTESEEQFEVDAEILEVFGEEADYLLESIQQNLAILSLNPTDRDALWEIKKSSHTFKGAAGIVGLRKLSEVAHRIEDLLARISEKNSHPSSVHISLLHDAADCLQLLSSADNSTGIDARLAELQRSFDNALNFGTSNIPPADDAHGSDESRVAEPKAKTSQQKSSIVRISLEKLDDLSRQIRQLVAGQSAFKRRFSDLETQIDETQKNTLRLKAATLKIEKLYAQSSAGKDDGSDADLRRGTYELSETARDACVIGHELESAKTDLDNLYQIECGLIDEIESGVMRLRNVEFGTITNRLQRTVRVTCDEEGKSAEVIIENGSLEIDTLVIDALIEPLLHLLKNAIVHGIEPAETRRILGKPEVGKITVRVNNRGAYVALSVTDDGGGIAFRPLLEKAVASNTISRAQAEQMTPAKIHELIFLPGLTTAEKLSLNAGRGVGMSIVRESIAAAGGLVTIETWPQKGTTFTVRIPRRFAERASVRDQSISKYPLQIQEKKLTVLIVDDSPSVRLMTSKVVENAGWSVETARDGVEALEKLRVMPLPSVILSDIEMPRMGGYEFVAVLTKDEKLKEIPVIFISSRTNERERSEAAGVTEYLTKPYDETKLVELIATLAARSELVAD